MHTPRLLSRAPRLRARGLTLIELVASLAILAILLGLGAPTFSYMMADRRVKSEKSNMLDSLLVAREEARQTAAPTAVCASSDGSSCDNSAWNEGHIVFRDTNGNADVDSGESVLLRVTGAASGITIHAVEQASDAAVEAVRFDAAGKLAFHTTIEFTVCKEGVPSMLVVVRRNGQVRAEAGEECA